MRSILVVLVLSLVLNMACEARGSSTGGFHIKGMHMSRHVKF